MHGRQPGPGTRPSARTEDGRGGIPLQPLDRSHLLRRASQFPFPMPLNNGRVRIRRERRVCESFSGIRSLARNERD